MWPISSGCGCFALYCDRLFLSSCYVTCISGTPLFVSGPNVIYVWFDVCLFFWFFDLCGGGLFCWSCTWWLTFIYIYVYIVSSDINYCVLLYWLMNVRDIQEISVVVHFISLQCLTFCISEGRTWNNDAMSGTVVLYANLKLCDIKVLIKSHLMRKVWNNRNPKKLLYIYSFGKTCLELCEVFRNASSRKMRPHCMFYLIRYFTQT
jgi:hypothetical protein